jgi:hypothetical protein
MVGSWIVNPAGCRVAGFAAVEDEAGGSGSKFPGNH